MTDSRKTHTSFVTRLRQFGFWGVNAFAIIWFAGFVAVSLVVAFASESEAATGRVTAISVGSLPVAILFVLWVRRRLANWGFCPDCRALCRRRMIWFEPSSTAYEAVLAEADGRLPPDVLAALEETHSHWSRHSLFAMPCDVCGMEWFQVRCLVGDIPQAVVNKPVHRVEAGTTECVESVLESGYARLRREHEARKQAKVLTPEKIAAMKNAFAQLRSDGKADPQRTRPTPPA